MDNWLYTLDKVALSAFTFEAREISDRKDISLSLFQEEQRFTALRIKYESKLVRTLGSNATI